MSYIALYREWRPQTFQDIVGQEHVTKTLRNAVEADRVGHAYLFCGSRGTGKTTAAKVLAKALNCLERQGAEPCNRCSNCLGVNDDLSVDVLEIDAASNRGIDEIRDLRERVKYLPAAGRYRIYIIDEVHMLTNEAFNALLKTLEEPPKHVVFVLATTEARKIPLTILSRCQRFDFRPIPSEIIVDRLRVVAKGAGIAVDEEALSIIARAAEGGLRDALSILDQGASLGEMKVTGEDVHNILGTVRQDVLDRMTAALAAGDPGAVLGLVGQLSDLGKDLRLFAQELAGHLRALALTIIDREDTSDLTTPVTGFGPARLLSGVEILLQTEQEMRWSGLPRVNLELALVKICYPELSEDPASLAARLEVLEEKLTRMGEGQREHTKDGEGLPILPEQPAPRMADIPGIVGMPGYLAMPDPRGKAASPGIQGKKTTGADSQDVPGEKTVPLPSRFNTGDIDEPTEEEEASADIIDELELTEITDQAWSGQGEDVSIAKMGLDPADAGLGHSQAEDKTPDKGTVKLGEDLSKSPELTPEQELEQVLEHWEEVLDTLHRNKPFLYPVFAVAAPLKVRSRRLTIGIPEGDDLSLMAVELPDNKQFINDLFGRIMGGNWQVDYQPGQVRPAVRTKKTESTAEIGRRFDAEEIDFAEQGEIDFDFDFDEEL